MGFWLGMGFGELPIGRIIRGGGVEKPPAMFSNRNAHVFSNQGFFCFKICWFGAIEFFFWKVNVSSLRVLEKYGLNGYVEIKCSRFIQMVASPKREPLKRGDYFLLKSPFLVERSS